MSRGYLLWKHWWGVRFAWWIVLIFISSIILGSSILFFLMNQPLSIGLRLLLLSIFVSIFLGIVVSRWIGYVLFLVYVGGLLVIFGYIAVCSPNVLYSRNLIIRSIGFASALLFIVFVFIYGLNEFIVRGGREVYRVEIYGGACTHLYAYRRISIILFLGLVLLLTLLAVVKVCYFFRGPLRPFI